MNLLTGNTRYRPHIMKRQSFFTDDTRILLVLQVEYHNNDGDFSPRSEIWRDAGVEDLAELERLKEKKDA